MCLSFNVEMNLDMKNLALITVGLIISTLTVAQTMTNGKDQNIELGKVSWLRNYDEALKQSEKQGKPVLILFQEVPGCSTCRNYGQNVLSHPLMVEAIENEFVPLAIYNNKGGHDGQILKRYNEPSWNNPVVRIVDSKGVDIVSRVSGNYSSKGLFTAMQRALIQSNLPIPEYMQILKQELGAVRNQNVQEKYYKMFCFWSGEGHLGLADGVLATEPGFMNGYEVVKVKFDQTKISESKLDKYAKSANCSVLEAKGQYRTDKDPQYYLKQTDYKFLPLTPLQKTKINSAIGQRKSPNKYLSPKQIEWLRIIKSGNKGEILYTQDFQLAWDKMDMSS